MIEKIEKICNEVCERINVRAEMAYANDVEKVYVAKINAIGGYKGLTARQRRLLMEVSKDEVSSKLRYKLWDKIW